MIKTTLFIVVLFCSMESLAQLPPGTQPNTGLPAPKPKLLAPPDLQVTAISYVSLVRETTTSLVRISVTIKNNGGIRTGTTKLKGYEAWARDGRPGGWKLIGDMPDVASVNPGQSLTAEYVFRISNLTADKKFAVKVSADGSNIITEGSETNNNSSPIIITPPPPQR